MGDEFPLPSIAGDPKYVVADRVIRMGGEGVRAYPSGLFLMIHFCVILVTFFKLSQLYAKFKLHNVI